MLSRPAPYPRSVARHFALVSHTTGRGPLWPGVFEQCTGRAPGRIRTCACARLASAFTDEAGYHLRKKGPEPHSASAVPLWCPCRASGCAPRKRSYSASLLRRSLHRLAPSAFPGSPAEPVGRHHRRPSRAICATSQLRPT
jgi:hypothetical protein